MASRIAVAIAIAIVATTPRTAKGAPPSKQACADAATRGQVYRDDGKLASAVEAFGVCSDLACPEVVRKTCLEWLESTRARLPSVRVIVRAEGADQTIAGLTLQVDDRGIREGAPVFLDVGSHTLRATARGRPEAVRTFDLAEAQRAELTITLPPPASDDDRGARPERPIPLAVWIAGGVAVVGAASFVGFGLAASNDSDRLERTCAPACASQDRDAVFRKALLADVSLGVTLLAAGAAGYFFFTRPEASRSGWRVAPSVGARNAALGVSGEF